MPFVAQDMLHSAEFTLSEAEGLHCVPLLSVQHDMYLVLDYPGIQNTPITAFRLGTCFHVLNISRLLRVVLTDRGHRAKGKCIACQASSGTASKKGSKEEET